MAKHLRYYGEFASVEGHVNRVAIYQESETPFTPEEVRFPADQPLMVEWSEKEKHEVILGSSCTLKIISPSDRKFIDFYQTKYGDCRIDIWRDGKFYWTGCLDTEFYAEPYERLDNYEVSLTFSDFNYLSRVKFDVNIGVHRITEILMYAIVKTQCVRLSMDSDFDESFDYSKLPILMPEFTSMPNATSDGRALMVIPTAYVRTDNFYEDGEAMTYAEVIEAILKPLGVRMIQLNGFLYLYDLNTLYNTDNELANHEIYWTSDSQNLEFDKTYNNIKITWRPNASATELIPEGCWPDSIKTNSEITALGKLDGVAVDGAKVFSYYLPIQNGAVDVAPGFSMWVTNQAKNITLNGGRYVFKTVPHYDGDASEGVMAYARVMAFDWFSWEPTWREIAGSYPPFAYRLESGSQLPSIVLFTTPKTIISPQSSENPMQLRLTMECLVDCRSNPYEDAWGFVVGNAFLPSYLQTNKISMEDALKRINTYCRFLYIPVKIKFKPNNSSKVYCYKNKHVVENSYDTVQMIDTNGYWTEEADNTICYLAYYQVDAEERKKGSALCKWVSNRQTISPAIGTLSTQLQKQEDGQYIVYPTINGVGALGEIWVEVMGDGWLISDFETRNSPNVVSDRAKRVKELEEVVSFALVKTPKLEIISSNLFDKSLSDENVEYNAEVDANAKEELSIDTIIGSYVDGIPTARGVYFRADGTQIREFARAGKHGTCEELLCGTLFSQYCGRHVCLSGECRIDENRYLTFVEANQEGKKFICVSEAQDLRTDTSDAKFIEISPDNYDRE